MSASLRTCAALLGSAYLLFATAAAAETFLFRFKKPVAAQNWADFNEAWDVQNGAFRPDFALQDYAVSWYFTSETFKNIKAEFVIVDLPEFQSIGGFIRAKFRGETVSGYFVELVKTDEDQNLGTVKLLKYVDLNPATLDRQETTLCSGNVGLGSKSRVAVEASGNELRAYYNGGLVCSASDGSFRKGAVGVFAEANFDTTTQPGFQSVKLVTPK